MSRTSGILKVSTDKGTGFTTEELELIAEDPTYYLFADVRLYFGYYLHSQKSVERLYNRYVEGRSLMDLEQ